MAKRRVNMTIDKELYDLVKQHSDRYGTSISASMSILISQGLNNREITQALPGLLEFLSSVMPKVVDREMLGAYMEDLRVE